MAQEFDDVISYEDCPFKIRLVEQNSYYSVLQGKKLNLIKENFIFQNKSTIPFTPTFIVINCMFSYPIDTNENKFDIFKNISPNLKILMQKAMDITPNIVITFPPYVKLNQFAILFEEYFSMISKK